MYSYVCIYSQLLCIYVNAGQRQLQYNSDVLSTPNMVCYAHQMWCAQHTKLSVSGTPQKKVCTAHHIWCASLDDSGTPKLVCCPHQIFQSVHSKKCGVHSTPSSCHTMGCALHQPKFGVLCTPNCGVPVSWCAMHTNRCAVYTNCGVHLTPILQCSMQSLTTSSCLTIRYPLTLSKTTLDTNDCITSMLHG